jgi:gas vesicle protein
MSNIDTNASTSQKNGLGAKTDGLVKQAQDLGRDLKDQASELTQKATDTVKTQAGNLTDQAKEVASDAGENYVGNVANIIRRSAYEFDSEMPQAGHYIRKAAAQLDNVSEAMRNKNMSEIVGNVQDFARKQPTAFFGAAVLLGFAAVRFLKSAPAHATQPARLPAAPGSNVGGTTAGM